MRGLLHRFCPGRAHGAPRGRRPDRPIRRASLVGRSRSVCTQRFLRCSVFSGPTHLFAVGAMMGLGHGIAYPAVTALAIERADAFSRGMVVSIIHGAFNGGHAFFAYGLGLIADSVELQRRFLDCGRGDSKWCVTSRTARSKRKAPLTATLGSFLLIRSERAVGYGKRRATIGRDTQAIRSDEQAQSPSRNGERTRGHARGGTGKRAEGLVDSRHARRLRNGFKSSSPPSKPRSRATREANCRRHETRPSPPSAPKPARSRRTWTPWTTPRSQSSPAMSSTSW